jgi:putative DNA methylase
MCPTTSDSLLARVSWADVDELVRRQQRNREVHAPGISLYRWWARRPHALIGALLDAACDDDVPVVSDPFSGGGTVAMEAARRGLSVYAQDLHPWAAAGLATTLDGVDAEALTSAGARWLEGLSDLRSRLYATNCPAHGPGEVVHTLWARAQECTACQRDIFLFPYSLVTVDSRRKDEPNGWFGCRACGHVTRSRLSVARRACGGCSRRLEDADQPLLLEGRMVCPHAGCGAEQPAYSSIVRWKTVLIQRLCKNDSGNVVLHFARPSEQEVGQAHRGADDLRLPEQLIREIPDGVETRRLRRAGLKHWCDLYPPRQLASLLAAANAIRRMRLDAVVRNRLRMAICGAAEMAGYASRWDRYYPKAFEATANHRFTLTGLACETNLLSDTGRGTLPRRLGHSVRAARWSGAFEIQASGTTPSRGRRHQRPPEGSALVARGSSTRQLLPDDSIDLVLTDPPYFDDVQYAELAALFLTWAQSTGVIAANVRLDLSSEAVGNARRSAGVEHYRSLLTRILIETARTLAPRGRMLLTFHNSDGRAWWALGRALGQAGFGVGALAVAHAENETDHAKRNRNCFSRDLVLECRIGHIAGVHVVNANVTGESAELIAAGRAVAELSVPGRRLVNYRTFSERLRGLLGHEPSLIRLEKPRSNRLNTGTGSAP